MLVAWARVRPIIRLWLGALLGLLLAHIVFHARVVGGNPAWGSRFILTPVWLMVLVAVPLLAEAWSSLGWPRKAIAMILIGGAIPIQLASVAFPCYLEGETGILVERLRPGTAVRQYRGCGDGPRPPLGPRQLGTSTPGANRARAGSQSTPVPPGLQRTSGTRSHRLAGVGLRRAAGSPSTRCACPIAVAEYSSSGQDLGLITSTGLNDPYGITFGPNGNLFVANLGNNTIEEFSPSGTDPGGQQGHALRPVPVATVHLLSIALCITRPRGYDAAGCALTVRCAGQ